MLNPIFSSTKTTIKKALILFALIGFSQIQGFSQSDNLKVLENPIPKYPPAALAVKAQGITTCQIIVDRTGTVEQTVMLSGHPLLRSATEASVKKWKFDEVSGDAERKTVITIEYLITEEKSLNQEQIVEFKNPLYAVIKSKQIEEVKTCCARKSFFGKIADFFKNLFS